VRVLFAAWAEVDHAFVVIVPETPDLVTSCETVGQDTGPLIVRVGSVHIHFAYLSWSFLLLPQHVVFQCRVAAAFEDVFAAAAAVAAADGAADVGAAGGAVVGADVAFGSAVASEAASWRSISSLLALSRLLRRAVCPLVRLCMNFAEMTYEKHHLRCCLLKKFHYCWMTYSLMKRIDL